ncbi:MAG: hypothetical protein KGZ39_03065 [Simkania sp.]|nr:hypothetical protein [Simkania sp.]
MKQIFRCLLITMLLACCNCIARDAPSCSRVLDYINKQLPHCGVLKESNGFVYLDVTDDYIHKLISIIQENGFEEPPYFGSSELVGAHITVVYQNEAKKYGVGEIQEQGETICFTPKGCKVVHPPHWQEVDEIYLVVIEAPELDRIRKKYGLPRREYDFHITIGVKPKAIKAA